MKSYSVFLGLGSNVGKRHAYLQRAVDELKMNSDVKVVWTSSVYESDPYGKTGQPKFLNAAVEIETTLSPETLYERAKEMEQRLGRTHGERWGPREIDIDLLVYDGLVFQNTTVTIPHPEMEKRKFVLVPLQEIAPDLVHPVNGMTVKELLSACNDQGKVVRTGHRIIL